MKKANFPAIARTVPPERGIKILKEIQSQVLEIGKLRYDDTKISPFNNRVEGLLNKIFGIPAGQSASRQWAAWVHAGPAGYLGGTENDFQQNFERSFEERRLLLQNFIDELGLEVELQVSDDAAIEQPTPKGLDRSGDVNRIVHILRRFHLVAKQLTSRHDDRTTILISDEYDAQDLLHALLLLEFDDVRDEDVVPEMGGKGSRIDFVIRYRKIVVEVKMASKKLTDAKIAEQIYIDIARYRNHPDTGTLVAFIYDPNGELKNAAGLSSDIEAQTTEKLRVIAVVT